MAIVHERISTVEIVSSSVWELVATPRIASGPAVMPPRGPWELLAAPHTRSGMGTPLDCCSKTPPWRVAKERPVQQLV